ncbi:short-chain dehydrogenase [Myriangium duriaei CBS 260.36]|uniref:Short-chain dehydrogenase n=1 Tax=Myriangium duriaei CBS 260.36 TaxID=1168546 RepID=A0A9P4IUF5_9PEZI|nr:short-chain dehydrogenase [Myriangium duriaei CBS 260.36]
MASKTIVLITGGNTGLGLETVKAMLQSPTAYHILLGSRAAEKGHAAIESLKKDYPQTSSTLELLQIDIESDSSITSAFDTVKSKYGRVDVLLNNAGGSFDRHIADNTMSIRDAWNAAYNLNVAGTHYMTHVFAPLLLASTSDVPRLLFIASGTSTLTGTSNGLEGKEGFKMEVPPAGWPKKYNSPFGFTAYQTSKTGMNMMMLNWHRIFLNDKVKVFAVSPGMLATGLGGVGSDKLKSFGALDPSVGANVVLSVVEGKYDENAGKVVSGKGVQAW